MSYQADLNSATMRDTVLHEKCLDTIFRRAQLLINKENEKGRVPPVFRSKYMLDPIGVFEKSFVRISMTSLYRRYRGIYIYSLTEALAIVQKYESKEEILEHLRAKLIEAGTAEKESKQHSIGDK